LENLNSHKITGIRDPLEFNERALEIFHFQAKNCPVYASFLNLLGVNPNKITNPGEIPFLPIDFFKTQQVVTGMSLPETSFASSGTTSVNTSRHYVKDLTLYDDSILTCFGLFFGLPQKYCILGLLPGYLERKESSLVYMVNYLQNLSGHELNGNFLYDFENLKLRLTELEKRKQPTLLFGVSFALLDFGTAFPTNLSCTTVIETGGMKGRKKEITREELHAQLHSFFGNNAIVSEYGMTELLSQAWFVDGRFRSPPWMKVLVRDKNDPLSVKTHGSGGLNIIDLANVNSCSFLATGDAGIVYADGSFNVLGRLDNQDIRGCNLMYEG
jgi:hypothetical protein